MSQLRLHRDEEVEATDVIPFPGLGTTRFKHVWKPRLVGDGSFPDLPADGAMDSIAFAEAALRRAEGSFLKLRAMVDDWDVSDRPRAA